MSDFYRRLKGPHGKEYAFNWQILSFLASAPEAQRRLLGPSEEWFCREGTSEPGANYLAGIAWTAEKILHESAWLPEDEEISSKLRDVVVKLVWLHRDEAYSLAALVVHPAWVEARKLAREVLSIWDVPVQPPNKPLWFPEVLAITWKTYKDIDWPSRG